MADKAVKLSKEDQIKAARNRLELRVGAVIDKCVLVERSVKQAHLNDDQKAKLLGTLAASMNNIKAAMEGTRVRSSGFSLD